MAFLKAILVILLVYYLLKILVRMFAPQILNYAAKKTESHFRKTFEGFPMDSNQKEEKVGDVIINKKSTKKNNNSEKVGEYIDFEEID
ncbi:DUF4834 family protein [Maribacter sp. 4G9]|uniref:DUF4834 family protein n=1 Tax=Maribacter sp. 4G9 TaxID=1889777 RepID=UPI000C1460F6|nr:DUF4834 family protein [Maribacter sp. 4G9]PIB22950.1 DUF4834 domain-containing protein [Maribacter sp. 4G9]